MKNPNKLSAWQRVSLLVAGCAGVLALSSCAENSVAETQDQQVQPRVDSLNRLTHDDGFGFVDDGTTEADLNDPSIYSLFNPQFSVDGQRGGSLHVTIDLGKCTLGTVAAVELDKAYEKFTDIDHYEISGFVNAAQVPTYTPHSNGVGNTQIEVGSENTGIPVTFKFTSRKDLEDNLTGPNPCQRFFTGVTLNGN